MSHFFHPRAAILGALASVIIAAPAFAESAVDGPAVTVKLSDVNFNTDYGARTALGRIETAADEVCGGEPNTLELSRHHGYVACRTEAVRRAVDQLNQPMLSERLNRGRATPDMLASR